MAKNVPYKTDPKLDLVLERVVDIPCELVWAAWTQPEHIKKWFTPAPWKTLDCEIDLRPGGIFRTLMQSPEGEKFPNIGCYLEVVKNERLVWTSTLTGAYRPAPKSVHHDLPMTAIIALEPQGTKTKHTAIVLHADEETRKRHADMGFELGWGTALDQLVAHMKSSFSPVQIKEVLSQAASKKWPYPQMFDALKAIGVEYYETAVTKHEITYHGAGQHHTEAAPKGFKTLPASPRFDEPNVRAAILRSQRREIDYTQFLKEIAAAGVHTYSVDMNDRTVSYRGANGEKYIEKVPQP